MIADALVSLAIWFFQNTILKYLPVNLPLFSHSAFESALNSQTSILQNIFVIFNCFINVNILISLVGALIAFEFGYFMIRIGNWGVNLFRGSGAKA